ncbi:MAG: glycosyltransferase family 9 protein [Flavobacteriales bacterium]
MAKLEEVKFDCTFFKGHIPCKPNKLRNKECATCDEYSKISHRILIIKLGAIGDVIRTTPIVEGFKKKYNNPHFTWLTLSPDVLPGSLVDDIVKFDGPGILKVQHTVYDIAINLDKDAEACMLLEKVNAKEKLGFIWKNNHIDAATPAAKHKLITGFFDTISKKNTRHYMDEIFEICQLNFADEKYQLNFNKSLAEKWKSIKEKAGSKKVIGLNTGCGARWQTRLWPQESWIQLIKQLQKDGYYPVVLGGRDEHEVNQLYSEKTGCYYPGHFSLPEFIALSSNCDVVVTQVSMMMHIAIALQKPLVLMNNIFNRHEFYLYNNGEIVEPSSGCDCYYGNTCTRKNHCMNDLRIETVFAAITRLAKQPVHS